MEKYNNYTDTEIKDIRGQLETISYFLINQYPNITETIKININDDVTLNICVYEGENKDVETAYKRIYLVKHAYTSTFYYFNTNNISDEKLSFETKKTVYDLTALDYSVELLENWEQIKQEINTKVTPQTAQGGKNTMNNKLMELENKLNKTMVLINNESQQLEIFKTIVKTVDQLRDARNKVIEYHNIERSIEAGEFQFVAESSHYNNLCEFNMELCDLLQQKIEILFDEYNELQPFDGDVYEFIKEEFDLEFTGTSTIFDFLDK